MKAKSLLVMKEQSQKQEKKKFLQITKQDIQDALKTPEKL